jgi:hypothetical protein
MKRNFIFLFLLIIAANLYAQQWGLYTLIATSNSNTATLVDTNDITTTFKTWTFSSSKRTGYSTYLIPGDTLVRTVFNSGNYLIGGGMTGCVQKVLWNNTVAWDFVYSSSTYCLHHDICPMPNGNVLMICYEVKTPTEVTNAGCMQSITVWSEKVIEVKPTGLNTGTIVWEWHLWDHLCQDYNSSLPNYVTSIIMNPQLMNINYNIKKDWWHMNGIDYNPVLDQIVVSAHYMNEFYVIDHSTTTAEAASHSGGNSGKGGDLLYRWGNPAAYNASGPTNFNVIHDAHWVPTNNPNYPNYIAAYNNRGGTGTRSAFDIISPPYNGYNYNYTPGQVMPPPDYAYRYTSNLITSNEGNSFQLPNGNSLMAIAMANTIIEVDPSGNVLWTKTTPGVIPNAYRYSLCYVRGPIVTASVSANNIYCGTAVTLYSNATSVSEINPAYTYSWSSTPPGFTSNLQNPVVAPLANTTYTVIITNTVIGCSNSASVAVNCIVGIPDENNAKTEITISPNPTTGIINLQGDFYEKDFQLSLYNPYGKMILQVENARKIDLSGYPEGIYYLSVKCDDRTFSNLKVIHIK